MSRVGDGTPTATLPRWLGIGAYAGLFAILLPTALALWAYQLEPRIEIAALKSVPAGAGLAVLGIGLMLWAMVALKAFGDGLPMSPYPPERRVESWPYRLLPHPIYSGAVLLAGGAAVAFGSAAGLFVVTPVLILAIAAFVGGYEHDATESRLGAPARPSIIRLPGADETHASWEDRLSVVVLVLVPWLLIYLAVCHVGATNHRFSTRGAWDDAIPLWPWSEILYVADYPFAIAVALLARSSAQLRRFTVRGLLATVLVGSAQLLLPYACDPTPVVGDGPLESLMRVERELDAGAAALPAFHVVWAILAAATLGEGSRARRWGYGSLAAAIALSCLTTGMHSIADVLAAGVAALVVLRAKAIWLAVRGTAEGLANAWREWTLGRIRIMNHALFAFAAVGLGLLGVDGLTASSRTSQVLLVAIGAIVGAALWAQWLEGGGALLRPFGYFGAVLGLALAVALIAGIAGGGITLLAAFAVAAPLMHAIGRGRCLIQGCCHGAPTCAAIGIRYTHPRSRVTRLSGLGDQPLHPTPVYSLLSSLATLAVLLRLYSLGVSAEMLSGAYLVLTGLARFVEEHFRGEPQTRIVAGLRIYQWLSIGMVVIGAALSVAGPTPMPTPAWPSARALLAIGLMALLAAAAYGVDFPRSNRRFARLV